MNATSTFQQPQQRQSPRTSSRRVLVRQSCRTTQSAELQFPSSTIIDALLHHTVECHVVQYSNNHEHGYVCNTLPKRIHFTSKHFLRAISFSPFYVEEAESCKNAHLVECCVILKQILSALKCIAVRSRKKLIPLNLQNAFDR